MATITLAALRALVRGECDQESSTFVSDSLLNSFINKSADELYDLLVTNHEDDYLEDVALATVVGQEEYALPADFYKLGPVYLTLDGDQHQVHRLPKGLYAAYRNMERFTGKDDIRYWLRKDKLHLLPLPGIVASGTLWYVQQRTQLAADGDALDDLGGWSEYVVVDAAAKCAGKEESNQVGELLARKAALAVRIKGASKDRDATEPPVARDAYEPEDTLL